jgi:hypothetical protein
LLENSLPMSQADAYWMIRRRAKAADINLKNGGRLEVAQQIAAHESSRTTRTLRPDDVSLDEVERIVI